MNNVLIIEDDKEICVMIKDHLEKYNYQVFFTLTGANAIERIKETKKPGNSGFFGLNAGIV